MCECGHVSLSIIKSDAAFRSARRVDRREVFEEGCRVGLSTNIAGARTLEGSTLPWRGRMMFWRNLICISSDETRVGMANFRFKQIVQLSRVTSE